MGARHREGPQVTWQAQFPGETPFYGLGEKATGLNLAGKRFELWNSDPSVYERGDDPIYLSVPFVLGLVGGQAVGLFFDNTYRAWVDLGSQERGAFRYTAAGGELRLYVMTGTPAQVLERYTQLTGRMPLPPCGLSASTSPAGATIPRRGCWRWPGSSGSGGSPAM